MSGLFWKNDQYFNQPIETWDTSNVIDMSFMFADTILFNQPIGKWDTSNVIDMQGMFIRAKSFNQDISYWDTSCVEDMDSMFERTGSFNQPINSWNISSLITMNRLFYKANKFNQTLYSWKVHPLIYFDNHLFKDAYHFSQDTSDWWKDGTCFGGKVFQVMLEGTAIYYHNRRRKMTQQYSKQIKEELMIKTWHPKRINDWCLSWDEK